MNQVAFVISASNKDYEDVDITEVIQELAKRDIAAFDDDSSDPDWGKYDLILPTPSLDYTHQYERLLQWVSMLESCEAVLGNQGGVVRWNTHKSYLLQLREKGIRIPEATVLAAGSSLAMVEGQMKRIGCKELVVKPMVGASRKDTLRVVVGNQMDLENVLKLCKRQELLIQEFIPEILTSGELSLIYFNNSFSHAVRKFNTKGDFRIQASYGGNTEYVSLLGEEGEVIKEFGQAVLQAAPFKQLLYAR